MKKWVRSLEFCVLRVSRHELSNSRNSVLFLKFGGSREEWEQTRWEGRGGGGSSRSTVLLMEQVCGIP